ncbi:hypothetical protein Sjap_021568 [Stephania japonica]|uniref:Uncharacterized protein n=1 Tax=Stephania japonica TaxID=461633 RepID=A0AAP0EMP7_9MAGN
MRKVLHDLEERERGVKKTVLADRYEKVLNVFWRGGLKVYSVERLRGIFLEFGGVEDVLIVYSKMERISSAHVVMMTKDVAIASMDNVCGDILNPLFVSPLKARVCEFWNN